jgi:prolyl-tRNA synthetase
MALAESGEAALVYCDCGWAANVEAATSVVPRTPAVTQRRPLEKTPTPELHTIAELASAFGVSEHDTVKTMAGRTPDGTLVFLCVPGDRELNPVKADRAVPGVLLLEEEEFAKHGIPKGSLGPVSAPAGTIVIADASLEHEVSWTVGANEEGYHFFGAMPGRDFAVDTWADLVVARPGDGCPVCGGILMGARGIEVSQVFQLGTKYSMAMHATFTDEQGVEQPFIMGCYGVGVTRSLAAVIEQHHDEQGIAWPMSSAPLEAAVVPLSLDDTVLAIAERIWNDLADAGVETIIDDRDERAGVKFADADLIGWPYQIVVGKKGLAEGVVELKERATGVRHTIPIDEVVDQAAGRVKAERERFGV